MIQHYTNRYKPNITVYYNDYTNPFTVVDNGVDTLTLFYDDSTDAIENRLLLLENTFAIGM